MLLNLSTSQLSVLGAERFHFTNTESPCFSATGLRGFFSTVELDICCCPFSEERGVECIVWDGFSDVDWHIVKEKQV